MLIQLFFRNAVAMLRHWGVCHTLLADPEQFLWCCSIHVNVRVNGFTGELCTLTHKSMLSTVNVVNAMADWCGSIGNTINYILLLCLAYCVYYCQFNNFKCKMWQILVFHCRRSSKKQVYNNMNSQTYKFKIRAVARQIFFVFLEVMTHLQPTVNYAVWLRLSF